MHACMDEPSCNALTMAPKSIVCEPQDSFSEPVPEPSASLPFWSSLTSSPRQQDRVTFPSTIYHTSHMYSQIFEAGLGVEHCEFKIHSAQKKKKIAFKAKSSLSRNV